MKRVFNCLLKYNLSLKLKRRIPDSFVGVDDPVGSIPSHFGMLLPFLDVPHHRAAVLGDCHYLRIVGTEKTITFFICHPGFWIPLFFILFSFIFDEYHMLMLKSNRFISILMLSVYFVPEFKIVNFLGVSFNFVNCIEIRKGPYPENSVIAARC
jgi:hypothetical protein